MTTLGWLVIVIVCGIFYSAAETAFTSFDRILVINWIRGRRLGARLVKFLTDRPDRFLGTTLIGNNFANVAYSFLIVLWAEEIGLNTFWLLTVSPLVVLIISEILPKVIAYSLANRLVRGASYPMIVSYVLLFPIRALLLPFMWIIARGNRDPDVALSGEPLQMRKDLEQILVGAEAEGAVTREEGEILTRYLDARDLKVRQIMTPRTQMVAVSAETSPDDVRDLFRKSHYNILPVFKGDLDHIIGYVHARDFLKDREALLEVIRPLHAVPESKRIVDLLQEFKRGRHQAALVVDEYGGTDGIVTIKDVFEELVGPVAERFDPSQPVVKRISPGRFLVSGDVLLDEIERATDWEVPKGDYNTLGGMLSSHLGRIPDAGEDVEFEGVTVRVIKRSPRRVEGCLLKFIEPRGAEDAESP